MYSQSGLLFLSTGSIIIALDECSFYPKLDPRFGYSLKGSRAIEKKPGHKGSITHFYLLSAI